MRVHLTVAALFATLIPISACLAQTGAEDRSPTAAELRARPKASASLSDPAGPKPPELRGRENAALLYYQAWDSIDRAVFTDINQNYKNEAGAKLSEMHVAGLHENQRFVEALLHAASVEDCDWGVNFDEGPNALLPHLGFLRGSCRFLGADVRRCVQEGDMSGATRRVVAIIRMSTQVRGDRCLISSLVAVAMNNYAISVTRNMMTEKSLTPEAAHVVLAAFQGMPADPFGFKTCLDMERHMLDWTRSKFTGEHAGEEFGKTYQLFDDHDAGARSGIRKMDGAGLDIEVDKAGGFYDELDRIWGKAGKEAEFAKLESRVEGGDFGMVAQVLAPSVARANSSCLKGAAAVVGAIKDLEAYIRGEALPPEAGPGTGLETSGSVTPVAGPASQHPGKR